MIITMKKGANEADIQHVIDRVNGVGLEPRPLYGIERTVIAIIGDERTLDVEAFQAMHGVEDVKRVLAQYKLVSRETKAEDTLVTAGAASVGNGTLCVMAGPCAVESRDQIVEIAHAVKDVGATVLRGGAFKPRSSPYSFNGLGEKGLVYLAQAREATGLPVVTEVMTPALVPLVAEYADILQIGARNMQNYDLLRAVGQARRPVLLKRGMSATLEEFLMSAEYVMKEGNPDVILCERGIRTFNDYTRNTLDLCVVPAVKQLSHLPIIVDPSHGTGRPEYIIPMSKAAIAAGADGIMVEVHTDPERSVSDAAQTITVEHFSRLMGGLRHIAQYEGKRL
ncbi:3-deoxy-7-phosphoheptulonate synthase [Candidatus Woesearchaeota archaeon]|nr:3-deoxy-7-phosphoheptulonate synthase [Candidatus Woesearchaeota archaeon]